jgi:hypothetical protein
MSENPPIVRPSPADLAFMDSDKIADLLVEAAAILSERQDTAEIQSAEVRRVRRMA